jgi:hypothetical protein
LQSRLACDRRCAVPSPGRERAANYSPSMRPRFCCESSSKPTSPRINGWAGRATRRWHEPCRTRQFALRFADRMLRNLGAPIHCFGQFMRASFLRSSLITPTKSAQNLAPSRFDEPRGTVRYGVIPQGRAHHATGHMRRVNPFPHPHAREGADGQAVVCPLLRGSSPTRWVAPKQHRGRDLDRCSLVDFRKPRSVPLTDPPSSEVDPRVVGPAVNRSTPRFKLL